MIFVKGEVVTPTKNFPSVKPGDIVTIEGLYTGAGTDGDLSYWVRLAPDTTGHSALVWLKGKDLQRLQDIVPMAQAPSRSRADVIWEAIEQMAKGG